MSAPEGRTSLSAPRVLAITGLALLSLGGVGLYLHYHVLHRRGGPDEFPLALIAGLFMLCAVLLANGPRTRS